MMKSIESFLNNVKKEMEQLNQEYENMGKINREKSTEIRKSIQHKSNHFNQKKQVRKKRFDFIRNK